MQLIEYLGKHVSQLLEDHNFQLWPYEESLEDGLSENIAHYLFIGNGLELQCDCNDIINAIFMHSAEYGGFDESLIEFSFNMTRNKVREHLGMPSKKSEKLIHPILGECGPWDRFTKSEGTIHFEYFLDASAINKITLMSSNSLL